MLYPDELQALCRVAISLGPWSYPKRSSDSQPLGRGRGIRTPDILLPKQARYQTALYPETGDHTVSL